jgi:hypothetical protein
MKRRTLYFCSGSLVDHRDRDCPRLARRMQERGKSDVIAKSELRADVIPRCPWCSQ